MEDYKLKIRMKRLELDGLVLDLSFLSVTEANRTLAEKSLDARSFLEEAERSYESIHQDKKWAPARNVTDSKQAPQQFGANMASESTNENATQTLVKKIFTLLQAKPGQNGKGQVPQSDKVCYNCNKPGHFARNCPKKKKGGTGPATSSTKSNKGWQTTPPALGEPETKTVKDKTFHWCGHCKRWSTTHGTSTHCKKTSTTAEANTLQFDLGCWHTEFHSSWPATIWDLMTAFTRHMLSLIVVLTFCGAV